MYYDIAIIRDKTVLRRFMQQDRVLCAFALGDLDDKSWAKSSFYGAFDETNTLQGIGLVWHGAETPSLQLFGQPDAVEVLLASNIAPERVFGMVAGDLKDVFGKFYGSEASPIRFWRMAVTPTEFTAGSSRYGLQRLSTDDFEAITHLLGEDGHQIKAEDIEDGVFYGIKDKTGQLVSMAGTFVSSPSEYVGVVGHVYTDSSVRGRGYATAVTSAVTQELFRMGIDIVALNVVQSNAPAIRAYQKLGYRIYSPVVAGIAQKAIPTF